MSIKSVANELATNKSAISAVSPTAPVIESFTIADSDDLALDIAGGQTVVVKGKGFKSGLVVQVGGSTIGATTLVDSTTITFTSEAKSSGTYNLFVINQDGGTAVLTPGLIYSGLPTFTTNAGSIGSYYETTSIDETITASEGDDVITYALISGSLPSGASFNSNGTITGTAPVESNSTTYSFTIEATDEENQTSTREFSLTINTDIVTWGSPDEGAELSVNYEETMANVTLSAFSAAGYDVSYTANVLPDGLTLSNGVVFGSPSNVNSVSTLLTATAATTNRSATRTVNWTIVVPDLNSFYNILLVDGNNTTGDNNVVVDESSNSFSVTRSGSPSQGTFSPFSKPEGRWGAYFNGSGDHFAVINNAAFAAGTGDFEISFWLNTPGPLSTFDDRIMRTGANNLSGSMAILLDAGTNRVIVKIESSNVITGTVNVGDNQWHYVSISRSGSSLKLFVDGVEDGSATNSTDLTTTALQIAQDSSLGADYDYLGYLSNLRFVVGSANRTSAYTVPTTPDTAITNTQLLTCQSNRFIDNSSNSFALTPEGNVAITPFSPFRNPSNYSTSTVGGSGLFDLAGEYLTVSSNAAFGLGTGDFTYEAWIYRTGISTSEQLIASVRAGSSSLGSGPFAIRNNLLQFSDGSSWRGGNASVPAFQWLHVALARESGTVRIFLNGVLDSSFTSTVDLRSSNPFEVGHFFGGTSTQGNFFGYITSVRVVKGTALYSTSFTPPSSPLSVVSGTSVLLNFKNSNILDKSSINIIEPQGGIVTTDSVKKFGAGSILFDNVDDYLQIPNYHHNILGSSNFTFECWFYRTGDTTTSGAQNVLWWNGNPNSSSYGGVRVILQNTEAVSILCSENGSSWQINNNSSSSVFSNSVWNHLAVVRNGGTVTAYINGNSVVSGSLSSSTASLYGGSLNWIGNMLFSSGNHTFKGYLDDVRFTRGLARYTSNFTPTTTEF